MAHSKAKKIGGALGAVVATMAVTGAVGAFILGSFTSDSGGVTPFSLNMTPTGPATYPQGNTPAWSTATHTVSGGDTTLTLTDAVDGAEHRVGIRFTNGNSIPVSAHSIEPIWSGDPNALAFTYEGGLCATANAGAKTDTLQFDVTVLDASLIDGTESLGYRVTFDDADGSCVAPSMGSTLTAATS